MAVAPTMTVDGDRLREALQEAKVRIYSVETEDELAHYQHARLCLNGETRIYQFEFFSCEAADINAKAWKMTM